MKLAKENEESSSMPSFTAWCLLPGGAGRLSSRRRMKSQSSLPSFTAWCLFSPRQLVKLAKENEESSMPSFTAWCLLL